MDSRNIPNYSTAFDNPLLIEESYHEQSTQPDQNNISFSMR